MRVYTALDRLSDHPFHCWTLFSSVHILHIYDRERLIYRGVGRPPDIHPFHCWSAIPAHAPEQFLRRKARIVKTAQKTLGWPSLLHGMLKLDGFENPGISCRKKRNFGNLRVFTLLIRFNQKPEGIPYVPEVPCRSEKAGCSLEGGLPSLFEGLGYYGHPCAG